MKRTGHRYGPAHAQVAEIWRPQGHSGARPVLTLIHCGFWRQPFTKRLMHRLAAAVVSHGWVAYNVEYRRVGVLGQGGWPETFDDISAALDALPGVDGIDLDRVVTCGHSAGGHLALWAGTSRQTVGPPASVVRIRAAISLAGVVDLVAAAHQGLGGGAVDSLMGGSPSEVPERYALGSPSSLLPLGIPQFLVHGTADTTVPPSMSAGYAEAAQAAGDEATFIAVAGASHMDMIDPGGAAFKEVRTILDRMGLPPA